MEKITISFELPSRENAEKMMRSVVDAPEGIRLKDLHRILSLTADAIAQIAREAEANGIDIEEALWADAWEMTTEENC